MSGLIWVQSVCKGNEQTTLGDNELTFKVKMSGKKCHCTTLINLLKRKMACINIMENLPYLLMCKASGVVTKPSTLEQVHKMKRPHHA